MVDRWAGALYWGPCPGCSFAFWTGLDESLDYLARVPRIWAERLAGSAAGARSVGAYDDNLLAAARSYPDVPLSAALWSIERARGDWEVAVAGVAHEGIV